MNRWKIKMPLAIITTIALLLTSLSFSEPQTGQANTEMDRLQNQINQMQREQQNLRNEMNELQRQRQSQQLKLRQLQSEILELEIKMAKTQGDIDQQQAEIEKTEEEAYQATLDLEAAEQTVAQREELLRTRLVSMYESGGNVNYLEVLLGASSFGEFLQRVDFLSLLMQQDQKIFQDYMDARDEVETQLRRIEALLEQLQEQLTELQALYEKLRQDEEAKKKSVVQVQALIKEVDADLADAQREIDERVAQIKVAQADLDRLKYDGVFAWPVPDSRRITSNFGLRTDPFTGRQAGHNGTDIGAPQGTTIVAASSGRVILAEYSSGYGNTIIISHGKNEKGQEVRTLYAHIRNGGIMVSVGQEVKKGQKIAEVGSTGRSTGPHLHFEVHVGGVRVQPLDYITAN